MKDNTQGNNQEERSFFDDYNDYIDASQDKELNNNEAQNLDKARIYENDEIKEIRAILDVLSTESQDNNPSKTCIPRLKYANCCYIKHWKMQ